MTDLPGDLNAQLRAIAARLDRVDNDLMCHYAGISQLVANLSMNPVVAPNVALSLKTFNFNSSGQHLLEMLLGLVPGYNTFRQLQHLSAAALVDGMAGQLQSIAGNLISAVADQAMDVANAKLHAVSALAEAQANGLVGAALTPYQDAVNAADASLASAPSQVQSLANAKINAELALINGLSKELSEAEVQQLQNAVDQADSLLNAAAEAESAVSRFLQAIMEIAQCRSRSSIIE